MCPNTYEWKLTSVLQANGSKNRLNRLISIHSQFHRRTHFRLKNDLMNKSITLSLLEEALLYIEKVMFRTESDLSSVCLQNPKEQHSSRDRGVYENPCDWPVGEVCNGTRCKTVVVP